MSFNDLLCNDILSPVVTVYEIFFNFAVAATAAVCVNLKKPFDFEVKE